MRRAITISRVLRIVSVAEARWYAERDADIALDENSENLTVSDTRQNSHTYTIDWQPDYVSWAIDGVIARTKYRNETYNSTTQQYHFPQSPARIQMSLWPAGLETNGEGTVDWAGGLVDWDSQYMSNGYYYASVSDVTVDCYSPPDGFNKNYGSAAYYYQSVYGTNDTVAIGNNNTILASFYATGDKQDYCPSGCASASASGTSKTTATSTPTMSNEPETVPGMSGGGAAGNSGTSVGGDTSGNANSGGSAGSSGSSGSDSGSSSGSSDGGSTSFSQGVSSDGSSGSGTSQASHVVAGSAVALLGFFVAALML